MVTKSLEVVTYLISLNRDCTVIILQIAKMSYRALQAGIEFKKNLRVRFGKYRGLKLEYFWVVKSKKVKSFIRG